MIAPVGDPVPDTPHAVSVSLPSWKATVGYEEGEDWVLSKMKTGYPRFFIHLTIQELEKEVLERYGYPGEKVMLFPSDDIAQRCEKFLIKNVSSSNRERLVRMVHLEPDPTKIKVGRNVFSNLSCVFFPEQEFRVAKQVWQHSGDGVSSRRGEFCLEALKAGLLTPAVKIQKAESADVFSKGPKRYQRGGSVNGFPIHNHSLSNGSANGDYANRIEVKDSSQFVEERFGRNLNADLASKAKLAIKRRICGCLVENSDLEDALSQTDHVDTENAPSPCDRRVQGLSPDDVYLYPTGMSSIFNSHRLLMSLADKQGKPPLKSICFGFPYIDTLKILQKWGPGCLFYGNGMDEDLDDLEQRLKNGERYLALFTEFPSNPLLRSPNLARIRKLADEYDFAVVVDETVGNYININVLVHADIVVSSLTKIFSGDSNVMGGSSVLNPHSQKYASLKAISEAEYVDNYWAEDAVFMERNSRDFVSRIERVNTNADIMTKILVKSSYVQDIYYPALVHSKVYYDACKNLNGGYGGLFSVVFKHPRHAVIFFDALDVHKGPSLGTNFTLACPYTVLAHYTELDWVEDYGVSRDLVRISVGLEDSAEIKRIVQSALAAVEAAA